MIYRGKECLPRPFNNATGKGIDYLLDGKVVVTVHETRVITPEEKAASDAAKAAQLAAETKTLEKQAILNLTKPTINPTALAAEIARLRSLPITEASTIEGKG